ncbi:MAG: hypothetical protein V4575_04300 [Pseudomonadota bacterium]
MNKLISTLFATALTIGSASAFAATSPDNKDDASTLGTSESPQVQQQQNRTDKGPNDVYQNAPSDDSSNLGNSESPQVKQQQDRTDKGPAQDVKARNAQKNKVLKTKEENHGTTKGNKVQPTEPETAAPVTK